MSVTAKQSVVVVLGASPKPERYAFKAMKMLREHDYRAVPVNPAHEKILGEKCYPRVSDVPGNVDTVTLYLGKARSDPLIDQIVDLVPRRIIMNPGAENGDLAGEGANAASRWWKVARS